MTRKFLQSIILVNIHLVIYLQSVNSDLSGKYECRDSEHDAEGGKEPTEYSCNDCASQVVIGSVLVLWRPLLRNLCVCVSKMCVHGDFA